MPWIPRRPLETRCFSSSAWSPPLAVRSLTLLVILDSLYSKQSSTSQAAKLPAHLHFISINCPKSTPSQIPKRPVRWFCEGSLQYLFLPDHTFIEPLIYLYYELMCLSWSLYLNQKLKLTAIELRQVSLKDSQNVSFTSCQIGRRHIGRPPNKLEFDNQSTLWQLLWNDSTAFTFKTVTNRSPFWMKYIITICTADTAATARRSKMNCVQRVVFEGGWISVQIFWEWPGYMWWLLMNSQVLVRQSCSCRIKSCLHLTWHANPFP